MKERMNEISKDFFRTVFVTADRQDLQKYANNFYEWEKAVREATMEDFSKIDPNRIGSPAMSERIDVIGEKIFEKVKLAVERFNPIPYFFETMRGDISKTVELRRTYGGRAYIRSYGGYVRVSPLTTETLTIDTRPYAVHIAEPLEKFRTGRLTTADVVVNATTAILNHRVKLVFNVLRDAYLAGSASYRTDAAGASLSKPVLDNAINVVADETDDFAIVGRRKLLTAINDFTGYADAALEEIRRMGLLGRYKAAPIVAIKRIKDRKYNDEPIPTDKIFVVAPHVGRFVEAKALTRRTWVDAATNTFHFVIDIEDGAACWDLEFGHMIYNLV